MGNTTSKEERLFKATKDGDLKEVKAVLAAGANLEWKDEVSEIHIMSELYIMSINCILVLLLMILLYVITVYVC